ncbi:MAG: tetratricopeptide repeat protein [bacterium]
MANLFEHKDRRVVPNWRSFGKTASLGELNSFQNEDKFQNQETTIDEYKTDWKLNKTVIHAADLLNAAIVNNKREDESVIEAGHFILKNRNKATASQISLAIAILNKTEEKDFSVRFNEVTFDKIQNLINPESNRMKIRETKNILRKYPRNSILYVELSRYYSILGQEFSSIRAMKSALHLAPNNRFVLRCATRLFAHYDTGTNGYLEYIHSFLRKSPMTLIDPWLASAEISIATIRNRTSKFIKKGMELVNSKNISPFNFTELASSIGTVELLYGGTKKSREFFRKALISPNDNSLAQIEWASTKDNALDINPTKFGAKMNFEELALDNFQNKEYGAALDNAAKWFIDMPFSKRPIMFGSNLASTILKDQQKSISFLNAGLISHPNDPQLINNLAYALALEDQPNEAFEQLKKIRHEEDYDDITQICLTATRGLSYFRSGYADIGRKLYINAIEQAKKKKHKELNWIAILNYAREEIRIKSEYVNTIMEAVSKIPDDTKDYEISVLKQDVIELHQKMKNELSG